MHPPALELRNLRKRFGDTEALAGVDLHVGAGELLVVLGATGAGKTTLLRTIAGLESPDAGAVLMNGTDVTRVDPATRDVALVFQNFSIYPGKTVRANMEFPLRAPGRHLSQQDINERVMWAASMLRIEPLLDRRSDKLSGGQMQRVAIGRAIVRRPKLFLMDEPLTNLDAKLREALRVELVLLQRELKTPMVYVTHDQAEAMSMADRVVVLDRGRVLQVGTPTEVYEHPATPLVAQQVGQPAINVVEVTRGAAGWTRDGVVLKSIAAGDPSGDRALLGVRPEQIRLTTGNGDGRVVLVENAGPSLLVIVDWLGARWRVSCARSLSVKSGDAVTLKLDEARACLWEA
jgi:multiple sugar transport system ATP-binding protein